MLYRVAVQCGFSVTRPASSLLWMGRIARLVNTVTLVIVLMRRTVESRSFFTALDVDGSQDSVSWVEMFNRLIERVSFRNNDRTTKHTDGTDPESTAPTKEDWKARAVKPNPSDLPHVPRCTASELLLHIFAQQNTCSYCFTVPPKPT